jgi:hypothetical protein
MVLAQQTNGSGPGVLPSGTPVWTVSNPAVLYVNAADPWNITIEGLKEGYSKITVTVGSKTLTGEFVVLPNPNFQALLV